MMFFATAEDRTQASGAETQQHLKPSFKALSPLGRSDSIHLPIEAGEVFLRTWIYHCFLLSISAQYIKSLIDSPDTE